MYNCNLTFIGIDIRTFENFSLYLNIQHSTFNEKMCIVGALLFTISYLAATIFLSSSYSYWSISVFSFYFLYLLQKPIETSIKYPKKLISERKVTINHLKNSLLFVVILSGDTRRRKKWNRSTQRKKKLERYSYAYAVGTKITIELCVSVAYKHQTK